MKKRILASLFSLCLLLSLLPTAALATEDESTTGGVETVKTGRSETVDGETSSAGGTEADETGSGGTGGEGSGTETDEDAAKLSDNTLVTSTADITRAQMAEMVYEHESLKSAIESMAGGGEDPNFSDITVTEGGVTQAQRNAIIALYKAKIISGTDASTFNPSGPVTRGEFAVVLWRATGSRSNKTAMTETFSDMKSWYAPAVNCFYGAGLLSGTNSTTFDGESNISVMQVNSFLNAYATNKQTFIDRS